MSEQKPLGHEPTPDTPATEELGTTDELFAKYEAGQLGLTDSDTIEQLVELLNKSPDLKDLFMEESVDHRDRDVTEILDLLKRPDQQKKSIAEFRSEHGLHSNFPYITD